MTFVEAVDVLRAFEKRTRRIVKDDLDLGRQRLRCLSTSERAGAA